MKAIEFEGKLIGQDNIDSALRALVTARFADAYAPEDDVYEELLNAPPWR
jgi:hypothetical protein